MKLSIKNISCAMLVLAILLAVLVPTIMFSTNSTASAELEKEAVLTSNESVAVQLADNATETEEKVEAKEDSAVGTKAIAAAVVVGIAAAAGAMGMAYAIAKAVHSIARQPEADTKIRTSLMLGLVFIETAIIYALIVAILIIFVM